MFGSWVKKIVSILFILQESGENVFGIRDGDVCNLGSFKQELLMIEHLNCVESFMTHGICTM